MIRRLLRFALLAVMLYAIAYGVEHWPTPPTYHVDPGPIPMHYQTISWQRPPA